MKQIKRFLIGISVVMICSTLGACAEPNSVKETETADVPPVFVESEFAPLQKVIVSQSEYTDSSLPVSEFYLPLDMLDSVGGELRGDTVYLYADQDRMKRMEFEREALISVLENYGVEVLRPRKLTQEEKDAATDPNGPSHGQGLSNEFVRDPFVVVGDHVIESNFRKEYRRYEALTSRDIFLGKCSYVAMPVIDITDDSYGPYLEGGDVLVYHKQVFVGNSGYGSNEEGIKWLKEYLAPYGYEVTEVKLQGNILHLDCALSLVKEGLMIACVDSFADGIPEPFREWDCIEVSEEDAEQLAVNGLPVNSEVYITDIAFRDTIGKELENRGIKVEYLDFSATREEAGSMRCSTQPVLRVD